MVILWFNILKPLKSWILQEEEKNHKLRWDENQNKYIFITCNWKQFYHNIISGYLDAARLELRERSSLTPPQRSPQHHLRCWWGDEAVDGGLVTLGGFFLGIGELWRAGGELGGGGEGGESEAQLSGAEKLSEDVFRPEEPEENYYGVGHLLQSGPTFLIDFVTFWKSTKKFE